MADRNVRVALSCCAGAAISDFKRAMALTLAILVMDILV